MTDQSNNADGIPPHEVDVDIFIEQVFVNFWIFNFLAGKQIWDYAFQGVRDLHGTKITDTKFKGSLGEWKLPQWLIRIYTEMSRAKLDVDGYVWLVDPRGGLPADAEIEEFQRLDGSWVEWLQPPRDLTADENLDDRQYYNINHMPIRENTLSLIPVGNVDTTMASFAFRRLGDLPGYDPNDGDPNAIVDDQCRLFFRSHYWETAKLKTWIERGDVRNRNNVETGYIWETSNIVAKIGHALPMVSIFHYLYDKHGRETEMDEGREVIFAMTDDYRGNIMIKRPISVSYAYQLDLKMNLFSVGTLEPPPRILDRQNPPDNVVEYHGRVDWDNWNPYHGVFYPTTIMPATVKYPHQITGLYDALGIEIQYRAYEQTARLFDEYMIKHGTLPPVQNTHVESFWMTYKALTLGRAFSSTITDVKPARSRANRGRGRGRGRGSRGRGGNSNSDAKAARQAALHDTSE